jgi:Protein required for attachment to host cells
MDVTGTTWIVAADGVQARVFEERVRAGEVRERTDLRLVADDGDHPGAHRHVSAAHGEPGREAADEAERRFLRRVAEALERAAQAGAYERLAILAPPRALGMLRGELGPAAQRRLEVCDPHERIRDDADAIRQHLREARART